MLKRLVIGQKVSSIPGGTLNTLIDDYNKRQQESQPTENKTLRQPPSSVRVILVWDGANTAGSGVDYILPPGSTVVLGEPAVLPADDDTVPFNGLRFLCDAPTTENAADGFFAITDSPFFVAETGLKSVAFGTIPNACWAQVTINDEADEAAELVADETFLSSAAGGRVPIIWKPTGTGLKWCVVPLSAPGGEGGPAAGFGIVIQEFTAGDLTATPPYLGWGKINPGSFLTPVSGVDGEPATEPDDLEIGFDDVTEYVVYSTASEVIAVDTVIQWKLLLPEGKRFVDVVHCEGVGGGGGLMASESAMWGEV